MHPLDTLAAECQSPNWDGYGAHPMVAESGRAARQFLAALPAGVDVPSAGLEPDGEVTLEWYRSPRKALSLSFAQNGGIHFAALIGDRKIYGTEPFQGKIPVTILDLARQVMAA